MFSCGLTIIENSTKLMATVSSHFLFLQTYKENNLKGQFLKKIFLRSLCMIFDFLKGFRKILNFFSFKNLLAKHENK